jgi:hypothetical protein
MGVDRPHDDSLDAPTRTDDSPLEPETRIRYETRDPETYYNELRAAVARDRWSAAVTEFRHTWAAFTRDHPACEPSRDHPEDGSWTGTGNRHLDQHANATVDRGCDRIRETEETTITPAMRRIEADDPTRHLVGLEHRLKSPDRIKEKVADTLEEQPGLSAEDAMMLVKDPIRYTFQYSDSQYSDGVRRDTERLREAGFMLVELRNSWHREEYKGINSRWCEPGSGYLFEVQFHTEISFGAKQLTHPVYEMLRSPATSGGEARTLRGFQREVCRSVPVPPGAANISDHP